MGRAAVGAQSDIASSTQLNPSNGRSVGRSDCARRSCSEDAHSHVLGGLNMLMQGSRIVVLSLMAAGGLMLCSCGGSGGGGNTVPDSATIELPDGTTQVVTLAPASPRWRTRRGSSTPRRAPRNRPRSWSSVSVTTGTWSGSTITRSRLRSSGTRSISTGSAAQHQPTGRFVRGGDVRGGNQRCDRLRVRGRVDGVCRGDQGSRGGCRRPGNSMLATPTRCAGRSQSRWN